MLKAGKQWLMGSVTLIRAALLPRNPARMGKITRPTIQRQPRQVNGSGQQLQLENNPCPFHSPILEMPSARHSRGQGLDPFSRSLAEGSSEQHALSGRKREHCQRLEDVPAVLRWRVGLVDALRMHSTSRLHRKSLGQSGGCGNIL